jgi:hypothetical protein
MVIGVEQAQPQNEHQSHGGMVVTSGATDLCKWELHALEEYAASDGELSQKLLSEVVETLQAKGVDAYEITTEDCYRDDNPGDPHYKFTMKAGDPKGMQTLTFSIEYIAHGKEGDVEGTIKISSTLPFDFDDASDFLVGVFSIYDDLMVQYYPDPIDYAGETTDYK